VIVLESTTTMFESATDPVGTLTVMVVAGQLGNEDAACVVKPVPFTVML
jgi:hypothetical protein